MPIVTMAVPRQAAFVKLFIIRSYPLVQRALRAKTVRAALSRSRPCRRFRSSARFRSTSTLNTESMCLHRKKINLSTCLAGQAVGVKEVDDGIWLVSFMDYDLHCRRSLHVLRLDCRCYPCLRAGQ